MKPRPIFLLILLAALAVGAFIPDVAGAVECFDAPGFPCPAPPGGHNVAQVLMDLAPAALIALTFGALTLSAHVRAAKREGRRYMCNTEVALSRGVDLFNVRIVNISQRGARLVTDDADLNPGDEVALENPDLSKSGRIVWVGGGEAGLAFNSTLTAQTLNEIRRRRA